MSTVTLTYTASQASANAAGTAGSGWTWWEKFLFRILFVFTALMLLPIDPDWYTQFFESKSFFWYLSSIAGYRTNIFQVSTESGRWGLAAYVNWGAAAAAAIVIALIWTLIVRKSKRISYNKLYYWTRVAIRYRIALGLIAFGFLKVYPMQMPYPSLSNFLTDFGDYNTYKIYWQHVGISTWYQVLLGWVEVIGGVLMFFRPTIFIGALINAGVLFNIAHANFGYDGGVHVYSSFFVLFSVILLIPYLRDLWKLFIQKKDTTLALYQPVWDTKKKKLIAYSVKAAFVLLFTIVYGALRYDVHYNQGYLKEPVTPGLSNAAGYYNVTEFRLNDEVIPFNPLDSVRWQSVIFEKWSTLVYKVNKPFSISLANGTPSEKDVDRNYELAGIAGGQRFLYYEADTIKKVLYLTDKNKGERQGRGRRERRNQRRAERDGKKKPEKPLFTWSYERPSDTRIILKGQNEKKQSLYVVLDKIERPFPIEIKRSNQEQ
ncbi:MAG TPA: hypothetical protein PKC39_10880 [Ferruginibacter sp.]|nr:hypothetical protein [Ferruginibacter sp.]HMP21453.1 hypothetical protein [Ferruginibacter sp.]